MSQGDAYDAVVVGSGAGGGACAWRLAARGLRVLLLEAGPRYDPTADYPLDRADWELSDFPARTRFRYSYMPMQELDTRWTDLLSWRRTTGRLNTGPRRGVHGYQYAAGLGGSTLRFTGEAHRINRHAMQMRTRFGVAADWPVTYAELEPYYLVAETLVGVAGTDGDGRRPRSAPYPLPPHRFSYATQKLAAGFAALGRSFVANPRAALSRPYDNRPPCNYCGNCQRGCPRLDKGSVDLTFIRHAEATGRLEVRTGAEALRVEAGPDDRVAAVVYARVDGTRHVATGRALVLACGAVETPRLLLLSAGPQATDGLGNESGAVGRHLMETVAWTSVGLHPEPLGSHRGLPADGISWDDNDPDAIDGIVGGCRFGSATLEAGYVGPVAYALRAAAGWGADHKRQMRERFGHALAVGAIGESLPNNGTWVDLDPKHKDVHGRPIARIHALLEEMDLRRLAYMAKTCREVLAAADAGDLIEEVGTYDAFSATHVFGTCRMGDDPREAVVDGFGRSHRWRNLFVADASVFPSSGGGESPSLTIEALAIRTADRIAALAARGEL